MGYVNKKTKKDKINFNNGVSAEGRYDSQDKFYIDTLITETPSVDGLVETRYHVSKMDKNTANYINSQLHRGVHNPAFVAGGESVIEALAEEGLVTQRIIENKDDPETAQETIPITERNISPNYKIGRLLAEKRDEYANMLVKERGMKPKAAKKQAERVIDYQSAVQNLEFDNLPEDVKTVEDLWDYAGAAKYIVSNGWASKVLSDENVPLNKNNFDTYVFELMDYEPDCLYKRSSGAAQNENARKAGKDDELSLLKPAAIGVGLGLMTGIAIADVATAFAEKKNPVDALDDILVLDDRLISEHGNAQVNFTTWLEMQKDNTSGQIQMTYDSANSTFVFRGVDTITGQVVTNNYVIPAHTITGSGKINANDMKFTFMPNGTISNDTYKLNLSTKLTLDDLANMRVVLNGEQNGNVYMRNVWLNGTEGSYINGDITGNVSEVKNAHGYINITSGWFNGTGDVKNLNITGGKGTIRFNNTEVNGNLTGYVRLDMLNGANITVTGGKGTKGYVNGSKAGWIYYTNGKDPVYVEGNETLELTENMTFVGNLKNASVEGWVKLHSNGNMSITGYAEVDDINFYNATGKTTMNLTVGSALKGYISDFTIPKAGFNGTVSISADQIRLRANDIRAELQGNWNGTGTFQKINQSRPLGEISGYAEMDLANILRATGYQNPNEIMIRDIQLDVGETTISGQNAFFTADKPLELRLSPDSSIKTNGNLVDLEMKGYTQGEINTDSSFVLPGSINPFFVIIPVTTATGLVMGYLVGARNQANAEAKKTQAKLEMLEKRKITAKIPKSVNRKLDTLIIKADENQKEMKENQKKIEDKIKDYFTVSPELSQAIDVLDEMANRRNY